MHLALTYSKNLDAMRAVLDSIKQQRNQSTGPPPRISIHQVGVGVPEQISRMFHEIDQAHKQLPDILVSNAGYGRRIPQIWDISLEEFDYTLNVNLRASSILIKGVVERMKEQRWGRIVFRSSIAGYGGGINGCRMFAKSGFLLLLCFPLYLFLIMFGIFANQFHNTTNRLRSVQKGGMTGMMKNLSTRLAEYNISVNDVAPAMIGETGMIPNAQAFPEVAAGIPLGRLGTPEEVANVVEMCVQTGYLTGQSVLLAGGLK